MTTGPVFEQVAMLEPEPAHHVPEYVTLVVLGLLSLPALGRILACVCLPASRHDGACTRLYEDEDGIATAASIKAYTWTRPVVAAWLSLGAGLGACVVSWVLDPGGTYGLSSVADIVSWVRVLCPIPLIAASA